MFGEILHAAPLLKADSVLDFTSALGFVCRANLSKRAPLHCLIIINAHCILHFVVSPLKECADDKWGKQNSNSVTKGTREWKIITFCCFREFKIPKKCGEEKLISDFFKRRKLDNNPHYLIKNVKER